MDLEDNNNEGAKDWVRKYWQSAKPLQEYLKEQAKIDEKHQRLIKTKEIDEDEPKENAFGFNFPELLIPYEIPTNQIKVYQSNI